MGSLMAGWDAPIADEQTARVRRNKSLTREEINAFWRSKSPRASSDRDMNFSPYNSPVSSPGFLNDTQKINASTPFSRSQNDVWSIVYSQSLPNSPKTHEPEEKTTTKSVKTGAWWTRSNSAFLNEPPREEMHGVAHKYTPQFNVMGFATGHA